MLYETKGNVTRTSSDDYRHSMLVNGKICSYDIKVLYPVGCIILCVGGLIVTINLFINTVKDDKILRSKIDQKKEKE